MNRPTIYDVITFPVPILSQGVHGCARRASKLDGRLVWSTGSTAGGWDRRQERDVSTRIGIQGGRVSVPSCPIAKSGSTIVVPLFNVPTRRIDYTAGSPFTV